MSRGRPGTERAARSRPCAPLAPPQGSPPPPAAAGEQVGRARRRGWAPRLPSSPGTDPPASSAPGPTVIVPSPRHPEAPRPRRPRYSPAAPVAAAGGAGARLGVAVLLQGCGREGVEEAGGQRRPAEAAARPGQEESQLHLARLPAGPRSPRRDDRGQRTRGGTRPAAPARRRASERASERARVRAESVWGAPTPLQGRLFEFGEVGSTPSKGAWGFVVNPRRSGAEEAAEAAELKFERRWGSQKP